MSPPRRRLKPAQRVASPRVYYGVARVPSLSEVTHGGVVKVQRLAEVFPNRPRDFDLVYLVSSAPPARAARVVRSARRAGARVVWNQNGVAYPGWAGRRTGQINRPMARALHAADHVLFQSEFCKLSSDRFLGERRGPWEVLHNPVDTAQFIPGAPPRELTLLLGGTQYQRYRLETALETLALLPGARLIVTGALNWGRGAPREGGELIARLGLEDRVELTGPYTQAGAPALLRRASLLLHTKVNDPCPGVVLEAMACGLPVVYSATGGTPELVGADAGIGVSGELDFERDRPPAPEALAEAVSRVAERLGDYAEAARRRSERFGLEPWLERHRVLFAELLA